MSRNIPDEVLVNQLAGQMRNLIDSDCFNLVIQPIIDLRCNRVVGGEVLSRLNHPQHGLVMPFVFLQAVDKSNLTVAFDRYVFGKTCLFMYQCSDHHQELEFLSCNFSRKTLTEPDIADYITDITDTYGLSHDRLVLELTEQDLPPDLVQFQQNIQVLKDRGFRIAVDDMGSGITTMRDLTDYPVDIVKLDRDILLSTETKRGFVLFNGICSLAGSMGADALCEGIEQKSQLNIAQDANCRYGQGYILSPPVNPQAFLTFLNKGLEM